MKFLRFVFSKLSLSVLLGVPILLLAFWWIIPPPPPVWEGLELSKIVRDREGGILIFTMTSDEQFRARSEIGKIPDHVIDATLTYEDRHFNRHPGVNPVSLLRSMVRYAFTRQRRFGASTIAMQAARLRWNICTTTARGKTLQIWRALQLVRHHGRSDVLELYYTLAPYGRNYQGLAAAAHFYFGKSVDKLTPRESVALAVIPQNPAKRTPILGQDNAALNAAVARLVPQLNKHLPTEYGSLHKGVPSNAVTLRAPESSMAPHFGLYVLGQMKDTYDLTTTLDPVLQIITQRTLHSWLQNNSKLGVSNAAVIILHRDGSVLSYLGSANFWDTSILGQNDILKAPRSPGSTLKPFIYTLALQAGHIHPFTLLLDSPRSYAEYTPENNDRDFIGPVDAASALLRSRNLPAVKLAAKLQSPSLYDFLKIHNVPLRKPAEHYGLALALGGVEITPIQLARLYLMLANNGVYLPIKISENPVTWAAQEHSPFLSHGISCGLLPEAAWLTKEMLRTAAPELQRAIRKRFPYPLAWKTGTSPKYRDAWCAGITGEIVILVWCGNADGHPGANLQSAKTAFPLMLELLNAARRIRPQLFHDNDPPPAGDRLTQVQVCALSGMSPTKYTPRTKTTTIIRGVTQLQTSTIHRPIFLDKATGRRLAFPDAQGGTVEAVAEFWPPEYAESFRTSGRPRPTPPPFANEQQDPHSQRMASWNPGGRVEITSPQPGTIVHILTDPRPLQLRTREIPGRPEIHWFVNGTHLGRTPAGAILQWQPRVGHHKISACTSFGSCDSVNVEIVPLN